MLNQRHYRYYGPERRSLGGPAVPRASSTRSVGALVAAALVLTLGSLAVVVQSTGFGPTVASGVSLRVAAMPAHETLLAVDAATADVVLQPSDVESLVESLGGVAASGVQFALSYKGQSVAPGDYVPMDQAKHAPDVLIRGDDEGPFALLLIDIDAPDPANPSHAPFLHYIVANLSTGNNEQSPAVVVPYYPVSPPMGEHRYVALLLRQTEAPGLVHDDDETDKLTAHRANFDVLAFVQAHNLHLVATSTFYSHPEN